MSSEWSAKTPDVGQPLNAELGEMIYEARLPAWVRIVGAIVNLAAVIVSFTILARMWSDLNGIAAVAFFVFAFGMPFAIADALFGWVRFYEHGIVARNWAFQHQTVGYDDVTSVGRDQSLRIHVMQGRTIRIPKWEGDFDLIEDILKQRCASGSQAAPK